MAEHADRAGSQTVQLHGRLQLGKEEAASNARNEYHNWSEAELEAIGSIVYA